MERTGWKRAQGFTRKRTQTRISRCTVDLAAVPETEGSEETSKTRAPVVFDQGPALDPGEMFPLSSVMERLLLHPGMNNETMRLMNLHCKK